MDFKRLFMAIAAVCLCCHLTNAAQIQLDTVNLTDVEPYREIPTDPAGVSRMVIEQLLRANARDYHPIGFYGRKSSYGMNNHVQYSVVSLWAWAIENARLRGDDGQLERLISKYEPFASGRLTSHAPDHVDFSIYGALPLEVYLHNGDRRALKIGLYYADAQWEKPSPDVKPDHGTFDAAGQLELWEKGLSPQSRYWIDDLYMITLLQVNAYRATGDEKYINRAACTMAEYLPKVQLENGFVHHSPTAPFVWGRGMGWVAAGMTLLLDHLPKNHEYRPMIMKGYKKMMKSLLEYQAEDGMWRQLVNDEGTWPETSCTAMFGYSFACGVRNGYLPKRRYLPAALKAWDALQKYMDCYGNIGQVCTGTDKRNSRDWYMNRGKVNGDPHGQAPLLWFATELLKMGK